MAYFYYGGEKVLPQTLGTYVYLASLYDIDKNFAKEAKEYSTFNPHNSINAKGQGIQPIRDAINQLKNIAATQAQKEHEAIHNYLIKINKHLQKKDLPPELIRNLRLQQNKIQNLDFTNYTTDSLDLIQAINTSIQDLNVYERRLKEIQTPTKYPEDFSKKLEFNIQTRLEKFLENSQKKRGINYKHINRDTTLSSIMDKQVEKKLEQLGLPTDLKIEIKSLLFLDFNAWLANNQNLSDYASLTEDEITVLYAEYNQLQNRLLGETHFQRLSQSREELLRLANEMKNVLHGTFISEKEYIELKKQVEIKKDKSQRKIKFQNEEITYKQATDLLKTYQYNVNNNNEKRYSFTLHSKVSHGNFYEFLSTILRSTVNIEGNVGGDLILPIATVSFTAQEQKEQQELTTLSRGLSNILTTDFKQKQQLAIQDFDEAVMAEKKLSDQMQDRINKAKDSISELDELNQKFFIAHETTKLYRGAEQEDSLFEDFHGRNMSAMSALTKLYASSELSNVMIDPHKLMLYLINISNATLAKNQQPLETYLSLFAGLLMFDDIKSLATTSIKQIQADMPATDIDCIHVYNIGGIYFPISVILNDLVSQMDSIINTLSINIDRTASVTIEGPDPSIKDNSGITWESLANSTMQQTKIQIHFLAGYSQYISDIFTNYTK